MSNPGSIDLAVRELIARRDQIWSASIGEDYEWDIKVILSDAVRFDLFIKDKIFQIMDNTRVPYEIQIEELTKFIFQLIEEDLSLEMDVPKSTLLS